MTMQRIKLFTSEPIQISAGGTISFYDVQCVLSGPGPEADDPIREHRQRSDVSIVGDAQQGVPSGIRDDAAPAQGRLQAAVPRQCRARGQQPARAG